MKSINLLLTPQWISHASRWISTPTMQTGDILASYRSHQVLYLYVMPIGHLSEIKDVPGSSRLTASDKFMPVEALVILPSFGSRRNANR